MKIWITKPAGADTVLRQRLHARWASVAPNAPAELSFIEAPPFTTHGELLTHIWDRILSDDDPHHVISELDFVPYDTFTETISNLLSLHALVLVPSLTRSPEGTLVEHVGRAGAWLIGINKS